ncbi:MAG: hypothetical protein AAFV07_00960 [Bacteroidota bacterium]
MSLFLFSACEEAFLETTPFTAVSDTVYMDTDNWFFVDPQPAQQEGVAIFSFSYQIFGRRYDGFLASSDQRIYVFNADETLDQRKVMLDNALLPGDTVHKSSNFRYHLLLDKRRDPKDGGEVHYILRRSRIGMKSTRERSLWVISPSRGILAVANYDIGSTDGQVTLDMVGDPQYFRDPDLIPQIKLYDYDATWLVDGERNVIYEFNKTQGLLKSRNYQKAEDLYSYRFRGSNTQDWVDFRIQQESSLIKLIADDSCYYFTEELELQRSTVCP